MKNIICSHFRLEKTRYLIYIIYVLFLHVWTFLIFKVLSFTIILHCNERLFKSVKRTPSFLCSSRNSVFNDKK
ncbi:hypothetical protein GLOIN_2v191801 [Rhizophagus irregularis DAOM 181602=DAOM 197198]|uniref:Uncharacterized protein n=1 Tax=Rhizophagus irregularis (strain DAOM 181602 / DAOM 197198 / MUCL 43194) TaxID=747089 RepID=U9TJV5_RHIID|nr:hypothetical protein GLOIN_2v191801 [Rhizophagus irregularis DAOM 181602=DAOM 197198]